MCLMSEGQGYRIDCPQLRKRTMLWLTGWSMSDSAFDGLRRLLPDYEHRYAAYGDAEDPDDFVKQAGACAAAAKDGDGRLPLIAGWSLGGLPALKLAAEGYAAGLILFGATARFTRTVDQPHLGWADAYIRQMIAGISKDRPAVEEKFRRLLCTEEEEAAGLLAKVPYGDWATPALIAGLQLLRREDRLADLPHIRCPVLLVHGTEDRICPHGAAEEMVSKLPQAALHSIKGAGHAPFIGREADIAEAIRRWRQ